MAGLKRIVVASSLLPYVGPGPVSPEERVGNPDDEGFLPYGWNLFEEVERFTAAAAEISREEPHDVIDCHDWITYEAGVRARATSGRPLVMHLHATERDRSFEGANPEIQRRERDGLAAADRVICNSRWMRRQIVRDYAIDESRVDVIPWGIDERPALDEASPTSPFPDHEPVVLFIGRVTRQKGPDYFIEVAGRVARHVPEARFVIAGSGDMLPWVIERGVELGLADRLHVAGGLTGPDVERAFRMAAVCVMPSVSEPFGLVVLESLRAGTPCIIPRESGAAEVVRNAFRADFWDIDRMTDQVVGILRHPILREELSERGRAEITRPQFGLDEPARLTAETYRRAIQEGIHA